LLKYSSLSWNHIQKILRNPEFFVRGVKISKSYKFKENEELEFPSFISLSNESGDNKEKNPQIMNFMNLFTSNIVFEDQDLIVINKPVGLASQGGIGVKISADQLAQEYAGGKLMHRIDKDISGLLLFGKSKEACSIPIQEKTYLAILTGALPNSGKIKAAIKSNGLLQELSPSGKEAVTHYEKISSQTTDSTTFNLARVKLETGRKHQIRVHCSLGLTCPVLGDTKYGGLDSSRIFLHSHSCKIKGNHLEASLPVDFSLKLEELGLKT
jgi:23S rRNA pseudouridine955/2504/2580 synthase